VTAKECFLCEIIAGHRAAHIVWSDEEFVAFLDAFPISAGHLVLAPRLHVDSVFDLPGDLYARLFERVRTLSGAVARAQGAPRTGLAVEGFGVAHAHVHLVPVWRGTISTPAGKHPPARTSLRRRPTICIGLSGRTWKSMANKRVNLVRSGSVRRYPSQTAHRLHALR
jgi:histidine triad (HIT) family protein